MPHELETVNGTTFFADSRDDAWHQLGQKVGHNMTAQEVMEYAHLGGWNVRKAPLTVAAEVGEDGVHPEIEVPDQFAVVRTNPITAAREYLGVVGSVYDPIQNEANAEFLQLLSDEFGAPFETGGSLYGGRDVFITMKLPHTMEIQGQDGYVDKTEYYLAALNNHTGQSAFRVILTPIRIVCKNTQQAALAQAKSVWKIRHTETATQRVAEARDSLRITWKSIDLIDAEFQRMAEIPVTHREATEFAEKLVDLDRVDPDGSAATRRRNASGMIVNLFANSPTITPVGGTRFALYNAVTEYVDWYQGVRGVGPDASDKAKQDARALRSIRELESSSTLKQQAFSLLRV
jgi:phage/plasmid-like protein (TIGR03299 family)